MDKKHTNTFLSIDEDNYIKNLSSSDLIARKCLTYTEYLNKIENTGKTFSETDINKLKYIFKHIYKIFKNPIKYIKYDNILQYIDFSKILDFEYNISLIDNKYENGYPHTRKNIIFITKNILKQNDIDILKIIIHEIIHIYQRYNVMRNYLKKYKEIERKEYHRSNPDTNNKIYEKKGVKIMRYRDKNPRGIWDVKHTYEHPYEEMAYKIEKLINYNLNNRKRK